VTIYLLSTREKRAARGLLSRALAIEMLQNVKINVKFTTSGHVLNTSGLALS